MKEFAYHYKLQEAILSMILHRFVVREDQDNLERAFLQFDADHDGVISYHEFVFAYEHYYFNAVEELTKEEMNQIFERCDLDQDGVIDWHDFMLCSADKGKILTSANLEEAFAAFDRFQKGFVTFDDFNAAYGYYENVGKDVWDDIVKEGIQDDEGLMSLPKFKEVMMQMVKTSCY